jgi:colanic acid/amylovoran biosynthesis protein
MISKYADIIFAREIVSYNHLVNAGVDENKIKLYPDFTTLVEGVFPKQYESVIGDVCIIPNMLMIDKDAIAKESYLLLMIQIIEKIRKNGERPFLLNHGGKDDALLCKMINDKLDKLLIIADNLTALEVKGIISQSSMLISSRFHGVASALNSGVPCLATSWSHKYEELFKDYGQSDCLMNLNDIEENLNKINFHLQKHEEVSNHLENMKATIIEKNREMWNIVWKYNG